MVLVSGDLQASVKLLKAVLDISAALIKSVVNCYGHYADEIFNDRVYLLKKVFMYLVTANIVASM